MPPSSQETPPTTTGTLQPDDATPTEPESAPTSASTALAVADAPTGLQRLPEDGFAESVAFKALDLRINRSTGEFWLDGDPQPRNTVQLVPRGCHRAQMFYGLPYKPGDPHEPSCQSIDGKHGYGWIDLANQANELRKCAGCVRKGFGGGSCTDLMVMLAYDLERDTPIMCKFQNAELNNRKGVFTLAVNRFRSMGLKPIESKLTLSFVDVPQTAYKALVIDVEKVELPADVVSMMDVCWAAYEESRAYEVQELLASADGEQIVVP